MSLNTLRLDYFEQHRISFVSGCRKNVPRGYVSFHRHEALEIIHQFGGEGVVTTAEGPVMANRHQVLILPARVPHDHDQRVAGETFNLLLTFSDVVPAELQRAHCVAAADFRTIRELHEMAQIPAAPSRFEQICLDYRVTALFLRLLLQSQATEAGVSSAPPANIAQRAEAYLNAHFRTIERVEEVGDALYISPDYLRHQFKQHFGMSLSQRLTQLRLQEARLLLLNTDWSQHTIAQSSGFQDVRYFSRRFRQLQGCLPSEFRATQERRAFQPQQN